MAKRRGGDLPARLRFSCRGGHTLVELLIGFLILTFVCMSWFEIMGAQNWTKESARREAVEQLHGMMDAFVDIVGGEYTTERTYVISFSGNAGPVFAMKGLDYVSSLGLESSSSIGYRLYLEQAPVSAARDTGSRRNYWGGPRGDRYWLCGELYDECGGAVDVCGRAFCKMKVFLGSNR